MLLNKLYSIRQLILNPEKSILSAEIELNRHHPVFEGHFPGNPILPGVCTVQIIKELLEEAFHKPLMLKRARNIKYLGFVNPDSVSVLNFAIALIQAENNMIGCSANITARETVVCSFKGEFGNY